MLTPSRPSGDDNPARGLLVVPIPGATAFVAALVASGLPSDQFFFAGFLPARANARQAKLEELRSIKDLHRRSLKQRYIKNLRAALRQVTKEFLGRARVVLTTAVQICL